MTDQANRHEALARLRAAVPFCEALLTCAAGLENITSLEDRAAELTATNKKLVAERDSAKAEMLRHRALMASEGKIHASNMSGRHTMLDARIKEIDALHKTKVAEADAHHLERHREAAAILQAAKSEAADIVTRAADEAKANVARIHSENHALLAAVRRQHDEIVVKLHDAGQELGLAREALGDIHAKIDAFRGPPK